MLSDPYVLTCTAHSSADVPPELGASSPTHFSRLQMAGGLHLSVTKRFSARPSCPPPKQPRQACGGRVSPGFSTPGWPWPPLSPAFTTEDKAEGRKHTLAAESESCLVHNEAGNISSPVTHAQLSFLSRWAAWRLGQATFNSAVTSAWALCSPPS